MNVIALETDRLIPYARNPRNNAAAVDKVAASLREFGWKQPIVVDHDMTVIAGHTRLLAAKKLNMSKVPVLIAEDLTPQQVKAYRLADNRIAEDASWDIELLGLELGELDAVLDDLQVTGFSSEEIEFHLKPPDFGPASEDDQGKLDELAPKIVKCPHCGEEFDAREQG